MRSSSTAAGRSLGGDLTVDDMDQSADTASLDPQRYFEQAGDALGATVDNDPVCLYLETTNRCNLLCTTCPRTFEDLEPPADMSWELFTSIVDQFPKIARVVLHGIGEPMMVRELPRMTYPARFRNPCRADASRKELYPSSCGRTHCRRPSASSTGRWTGLS